VRTCDALAASTCRRRGKLFRPKAAEIDATAPHCRDAARPLCGRIYNRAEDTFDLAMAIIWWRRIVLAYNRSVAVLHVAGLRR
jgi:hypothetical protein